MSFDELTQAVNYITSNLNAPSFVIGMICIAIHLKHSWLLL